MAKSRKAKSKKLKPILLPINRSEFMKFVDKKTRIAKFVIDVSLGDLVDCGGLEGLNNLMEAKVGGDDEFGWPDETWPAYMLMDIKYNVVGHETEEPECGCCNGRVFVSVEADASEMLSEIEQDGDDDDDNLLARGDYVREI